jgi:hypothetical protein
MKLYVFWRLEKHFRVTVRMNVLFKTLVGEDQSLHKCRTRMRDLLSSVDLDTTIAIL